MGRGSGALSHCCEGMRMGITPQERNLTKCNEIHMHVPLFPGFHV